jgi:hypothetical protein
MARRRAKTDSNQAEIVSAMRRVGAHVTDLSGVGGGVPDILVAYRRETFLVEIVGPDKVKRFPPDGLSKGQIEWHEKWQGRVEVVRSIDEALNMLGHVRVKGKVS